MKHSFLLALLLLSFGTFFSPSPSFAETPAVSPMLPTFHDYYLPTPFSEEQLLRYFRLPLLLEDPVTGKTVYKVPVKPSQVKEFFKVEPVSFSRIGTHLVPLSTPVTLSGSTLLTGTKLSVRTDMLPALFPEELFSKYTKAKEDVTISYHEDPLRPFTFQGRYADGQRFFEEGFLELMSRAILSDDRSLPIPLYKENPRIHLENIPERFGPITELVTYGVSDFSGSTLNRIHNIDVALKNFNGIVIAPGEEFSFNKYLGLVDGSTGYKKELVIKGPRTIPDYGGGVCQVSSTMFRAALHGGYPLVERKPHSYAVHYYEPWGTDATVYPGVVDFRFQNNSSGSLIVQAYRDTPHVYFKFYGQKDGRTVQMEGPFTYNHYGPPASVMTVVPSFPAGAKKLMEHGVVGFQAHWNRMVTMPNGTVLQEKIQSTYDARPAQYQVGPAAAPAPATPPTP